MKKDFITIDGNEAAAYIAYRVNEVVAIYPITPSSGMGELCDEWMSLGHPNLWGTTPIIQEMQSEGGAAGAVHGALQSGSLTTTFTASQGLLLMIPNMFKIAGELTPAVFHVAARSLASQALSIFGDHSDVMAARSTGFALLSAGSVQEVMDFALIAQASSLESRIPFIHFFDGFRTSHEVAKIEKLRLEDIRAMIDDNLVFAHRDRKLTPDKPVIRGTAQNPDVYFQAREACNPFYNNCPGIVQKAFDQFAKLTGRSYNLFDYIGDPDADRVIVMMGSGAETCEEAVERLNQNQEKVGLIKVRLFRPFSIHDFVNALPKSVKSIAVLDRTKEPGASGEPLYADIVNAIYETSFEKILPQMPRSIGGRYGLSSKEFTPAMVKTVFDELKKDNPKNHFTIGIQDDVSNTSLPFDDSFSTENEEGVRAIFHGLGSDGTVSANKNAIKIIGENTDNFAQGYFVYDSKKSGSVTTSHLRFGPKPIRSSYLIKRANFVGCHFFEFLNQYDVLKELEKGGVFLLNSPYSKDETWEKLPFDVQTQLIEKKANFYVVNAYEVAKETGLGKRINTVMQTCFFAISGVLPREEAIEAIKNSIKKTYGKKGDEIVQLNYKAVDHTISCLYQIDVPDQATSQLKKKDKIPQDAPTYVKDVVGSIMNRCGDQLPVSKLPSDGTFPVGTSKWEKRNISSQVPVWDESICIQCGKCVAVCPHAVIRTKIYENEHLQNAPEGFKAVPAKDPALKGKQMTIQVAVEDCTGCAICVDVCPVKNKSEVRLKALNMNEKEPIQNQEIANWDFFLNLPEIDRSLVKLSSIRGIQNLEPLFQFSGACAGCGETPYIKIMTQLFGDRAIVANATGCSSIYGGNLPTTPWSKNKDGRGPAWANSLFEDNAEFGLGFRLSIDKQMSFAKELVMKFESSLGSQLVSEIINATQTDEADIFAQRERVNILKEKIASLDSPDAKQLKNLADMLVKKSVWIVGGDGWAYDIGYGGLDHVMATGKDVNILVLDTEVYSNTGGQASKSTPRAAVAKFAAGGKPQAKKDLARIAMMYENIYVASVALGAKDEHTVKAFLEAEHYPGPSLIIAYSHCIAHGIDMVTAMKDQKTAVSSGYWPLFRYNPQLIAEGKNPFTLDSSRPKGALQQFLYTQNRYKMLAKSQPERAKELLKLAQQDVNDRYEFYKQLENAATPAANDSDTEKGKE